MKTKLLLLLLLANFSFYAQNNLVPNGGFESWVAGAPQNWTIANSVSSSIDKAEGQYSAKLSLTDKTLAPKVTAQVLLKAGVTYTVKFKYKYVNNNYSGLHPIALKIFQNGSGTTLSSSTYAINNNWTQKETTFTPDTNLSYDLSISVFSFDDETFDVLIDDVVVIDPNEPVAQYTLIPDLNFEKKLIALGIDSGTPDGKVLTADISGVTILSLTNSSISDLTGIEDFTSLTDLYVRKNQLTSINVSKNTKLLYLDIGYNQLTNLNTKSNVLLTSLVCQQNQITSLDVSKNVLLEELMCHYNNLTAIDVSLNPELYMLDCLYNQITSVDISKNPKITELACENNQLTYLNLKNGNNINLDLTYSNFVNNPNLTCIEVDDVDYANSNWSGIKDTTATFSSTCKNLGIADSAFDKITIYPNPTKGEVNINNITLEKATVYNSLGQLVKTFTLNSGNTDNTINLSGLKKGVYYVYLVNGDAASAKKVIVE
jgi:Leucine-rich repeat (LRR) protein